MLEINRNKQDGTALTVVGSGSYQGRTPRSLLKQRLYCLVFHPSDCSMDLHGTFVSWHPWLCWPEKRHPLRNASDRMEGAKVVLRTEYAEEVRSMHMGLQNSENSDDNNTPKYC